MSEARKLDLAEGVAVESLASGQMIEGVDQGERVLLACVGDRFRRCRRLHALRGATL